MADFGQTAVLDTFNRADGPVGANWVTPVAAAPTLVVNTNQVASDSASASAASGHWNADLGPDVEVMATVGAWDNLLGGYMYARSTGSGATWTAYIGGWSGSRVLRYWKIINGSQTSLGWFVMDDASSALAPGDKIGFEVLGDQNVAELTVYTWKSGGSSWIELPYVIDHVNPIIVAGGAGVMVYGATSRLDDYAAGTVEDRPRREASFDWPVN